MQKYIYDNGFSKRYYICNHCGSKKMIEKPMGGFAPPKYDCVDCNKESLSPTWEFIPRDIKEQKAYDKAQ